MMQQRVSMITLGVQDLDSSKNFYEALGWESVKGEAGSDIVVFNLPHMVFSLYPKNKLEEDVTHSFSPKAPPPCTFSYNVNSEDEVDEVLRHATDVGAKIIKSAKKVFWGGYSGYFSDPDGFLWEVAYNPFSPVRENGSFQW